MTLIEYAQSFIGVNYVWGGNSPEQGFDCSGYIQEVLASEGLDFPGDQTAQDLYNLFSEKQQVSSIIRPEMLLFFGKSLDKITHIAMAINEDKLIEAGGEGRISTKNGSVRVRPISYRSDLVAVISPK